MSVEEEIEGLKSNTNPQDSIETVNSENQKLRIELERISLELNARKRELEIEAALEKVRSTAMAMQQSENLKTVVVILYEQLRNLGFKLGVASIIIMDPDSGDMDWWMEGFGDGYVLPECYHVPYFDHQGHIQQVEHWKNGTSYAEIEISGQEKKTYDSYYFFKTDFVKAPESSKQLMMQQESVRFSMAFMKYGALSWSPTPLSEEQSKVMERFAKVFEQCYTRFLDLQNAEAQAREAQIEAALEKIRSKSLAMHHSEELREVITAFFEKLIELGALLGTVGIALYDRKSKDIVYWVGNSIQDPQLVRAPFDEAIMREENFISQSWRALTEKTEMLNVVFSRAQKDRFFEHLFANNDLIQIPENAREMLRKMDQHTVCFVPQYHSALFVDSWDGEQYSERDIDILRRGGKVFEQAYVRFLDLQKAEAQAREAQIEAALERVRARTMGMQKSEDLRQVVKVLYSQLKDLAFEQGVAAINIMDPDSGDIESWSEGFDDGYDLPEKYHVPYFDHKGHNEQLDHWIKGSDFAVIEISGPEKMAYDAYYFSQTDFKKAPDNTKKLMMQQEAVLFSMAYMKYGALTWAPSSLSEEQAKILKRFANVFEQSYTRFIDLKKAEAQAREAQIEAALERVRARTMAMHKSDELTEVASLLFRQIRDLGITAWTTGFNIWSEDNNSYVDYVTDPEGNFIEPYRVDTTLGPVLNSVREARKAGQEFFVNYEEGETIKETYRILMSFGEKGQYEKLLKSGFQFPSEQYEHFVFAKNVSLMFITYEPVYEAHDIFKRFGKVFEQTYTRFLDLQKAEAQAREAQVEAALEKIRATSLAMHHSYEIMQVVMVLFQKLKDLGLDFDGGAAIHLFQKETHYTEIWVAAPDDISPTSKIRLPFDEEDFQRNPIIQDIWHAWESGSHIQNKQYTREEKDRYFDYVFKNNDASVIPDSVKDWIRQTESYTATFVYEKNSLLGANSWTRQEFSDAEFEVLKRMARVFEQAYVRFLDLQKSEAQAREAQIEASLERVRSRTMAMQSSDELADAAYVLFEQLNILGVTHERINIGIVNEPNQTIDFWVTEQGGNKLNSKFSGRISEPTTLSKAYEAWKKGEKSLTVDLRGDALKSWLRYLNEEIKIPFNKAFLHDRRVQTVGFFSKGMLVVTSPEPLQEEALYLLEKFAGVFDLTYTRFSDLKLAEAHALQAEKDLVEIKIARKKAEDALNELKSTQAQLVQQEKLASLGQLTAGIAHEIKNPLNFVNNFSEVSMELIEEALHEIAQIGNNEHATESAEILEDIKSNLTKIHEHGSRANSIVSSMLQHSRGGSGKKEPTYLNALIKEYVNLSFHGMRASKNPINVEIHLELDPELKEVSLIKEDFTRVIINLCNNAFDAMRVKAEQAGLNRYQPKLSVRTKSEKDHILISVEDNGPGIPDEIKDKILQPFFTTKKGTEGTGLGLSITHDIVKAHGGELRVESKEGENSEFIIHLPLHAN